MVDPQLPDNQDRIILHHPRIDLVVQEIEADDRVLDIGCVEHSAKKEESKDHWLHGELCNVSNNVLGLDYLKEDVEELNNRGYDVVCMDAEKFELDQKFDVITAGELIEHLSNPGQFLNRVHNHLKSDGKFVLTTPNPWYIRRFFEALLLNDVHVNPEHTCWFDRRTLSQVFQRHQLDLITFQYAKAPYFEKNFSLENIDAVLTRSIRRIGFDTLTGHSFVAVAKKSED